MKASTKEELDDVFGHSCWQTRAEFYRSIFDICADAKMEQTDSENTEMFDYIGRLLQNGPPRTRENPNV